MNMRSVSGLVEEQLISISDAYTYAKITVIIICATLIARNNNKAQPIECECIFVAANSPIIV